MDSDLAAGSAGEKTVTVRYWASARAAAGVESDDLDAAGPLSLSDVVRLAGELHPGSRLAQVLASCSVLVGDQPVSSREADRVVVRPGQTVEFLPPFAGG
jgi:sulfur-carrier protein